MAADPPPEEFGVAEERSGHCAVVDGNCLYVWGGYVVRKLGSTGKPNGWTNTCGKGKKSSLVLTAQWKKPRAGGGAREAVRFISPFPSPPPPLCYFKEEARCCSSFKSEMGGKEKGTRRFWTWMGEEKVGCLTAVYLIGRWRLV